MFRFFYEKVGRSQFTKRRLDFSALLSKVKSTKTIHFKKPRPQTKLTLIIRVPGMTSLAMLWFSSMVLYFVMGRLFCGLLVQGRKNLWARTFFKQKRKIRTTLERLKSEWAWSKDVIPCSCGSCINICQLLPLDSKRGLSGCTSRPGLLTDATVAAKHRLVNKTFKAPLMGLRQEAWIWRLLYPLRYRVEPGSGALSDR